MGNLPQIHGPEDHENQQIILRASDRQFPVLPSVGVDASLAQAPETDDFQAFMHYLWILWRHKWALLLSLILGGLASLGITLYTTPLYRATASLEVQNIRELFNNSSATATDTTLATQAQ